MPGLVATLTLNGGQYQSQFAAISAQTVRGNASMAASAHAAASAEVLFIEQQLIAAKAAGQSTVQLTQQLAQARAAYVATGAAAVRAAAATTANSVANNAATSSTKNIASATTNLNSVFARLLIIMKDLIRGQWSRALSTLLTLFQQLGVSAIFLVSVLTTLGGAGIVFISVLKSMANFEERLADAVGQATARFREQAEEMRRAANEASSFSEWLERLRQIREGDNNSSSRAAEDVVRGLHRQFELEQKIAKTRGQTPQQAIEAQQRQASLEADTYEKYAKQQALDADIARKEAIAAENKNKDTINTKQSDLAVNQAALDAATKELGAQQIKLGESGAAHPFDSAAEALKTGVHRLMGDGEKSEYEKAYDAYDAARKQVASDQATLDAAKKEVEDSKSNADKMAADARTLDEKARAAREIAKDVGSVDAAEAQKPARQRPEHMILTSLQRIGAFVGPAAGDDMLRVQKGIAQTVTAIHKEISKKGHASHSSDGAHVQF